MELRVGESSQQVTVNGDALLVGVTTANMTGFVRQKTFSDLPAVVYRLNPETGFTKEWKRIAPKDSVGINAITRILISGNEKSYVYSSRRVLSELVLVDGWR